MKRQDDRHSWAGRVSEMWRVITVDCGAVWADNAETSLNGLFFIGDCTVLSSISNAITMASRLL